MIESFESGWPKDLLSNHILQKLYVLGRLRPGINLATARAALNVLANHLCAQYPETDKGRTLSVYEERFARPDPSTETGRMAKLYLYLDKVVVIEP